MFLLAGFSLATTKGWKQRINEMKSLHMSIKVKERDQNPHSLSLSSPSLSTHQSIFKDCPSSHRLLSHMKAVSMARSLQDSSSKRHFHWTNKVGNEEEEENDVDHVVLPSLNSSSSFSSSSSKTKSDEEEKKQEYDHHQKQQHGHEAHQLPRRKLQAAAVSRLRSVLTAFGKNRSSLPLGLGPRVVGTLFGSRRGHVHFALQRDPSSHPAFLIELATPISGLVKEMASGLVRIALECDKDHKEDLQKEERSEISEAAGRASVENFLQR